MRLLASFTVVKFFCCIILLFFMTCFSFLIRDLIRLNEILRIILNISPEQQDKHYITDSMITPKLAIHCGDLHNYDVLVVVHTRASGFERRQDYRDTYGNHSFTHPRKLKVVFLLGQPNNDMFQQMITMEHELHQDIVQGPFLDSYFNLTQKAVMGYYWMSQSCTNISVVIKMDDDVIFDVNRLFTELRPRPIWSHNSIYCHMNGYGNVWRAGKWAVPKQFLERRYYPAYCSGALVVIPFSLIAEYFRLSLTESYINVDDAFIYGIIREKADTQILHLHQFSLVPTAYRQCAKEFGPKCQYFAALLDKGEPFKERLLKMVSLKKLNVKA